MLAEVCWPVEGHGAELTAVGLGVRVGVHVGDQVAALGERLCNSIHHSSSYQFYKVSYWCIKWVTTSLTYSTVQTRGNPLLNSG